MITSENLLAHVTKTAFAQVAVAVALFVLASSTNAQETTSEDNAAAARADQLYKEFLATAESFSLVPQESSSEFRLQQTPLLRFSIEGNVFGSVFIWHDANQQPAIIGTIGSIPLYRIDTELFELHLLQPTAIQPVDITGMPSKVWTPDHQQLKPRRVPDAPVVADNERSRLVQMKTLARQFSGQMVTTEQANQLRLLPQPLYRLENSTSQNDYALFALIFDKGTDPEILFSLQAIDVDGTAHWHYQPIRFSWRELTLQHMGTDVWHVNEFQERESPRQLSPYITGLTRALP